MGIKIDKTIKLDHIIWLIGLVFVFGIFYATVNKTLEQKADRTEVVIAVERLDGHDEDISEIRKNMNNAMTRIEGRLIRIEDKIDRKVDK